MRILHVIGTLDPATGGPPMIAARLAAGQVSLGHAATIVAHEDASRRDAVSRSLASVPCFEQVSRVPLDPSGLAERLFARRSRPKLRGLVAEHDVVHLHGVWEPTLLATGRECRRIGRPYFILLNGMLDPWSMNQRRWKKRLALALGYRRLFSGAACLHLGNADERAGIKPLGLPTPTAIIPNGCFPEELEPLPEASVFYQSHPELSGRPFVLFLSRLHHKKGLDYLAPAFAVAAEADADVQLVVAGPDGGEQASFEAAVRDMGLTDRVHVVGPLYGDDKLAAYAAATVFCLPSRQEGFSVAITEALACGLPMVITGGCHFPEVEQGGAGRVVPLDDAAVGRALVELLTDASLRSTMSENGRRMVRETYNWRSIAKLTMDMYESYGATEHD